MICDNLKTIYRQIEEAAARTGRDPQSVRLVAVSKRQGPERILEALNCGQELFGENYLQEAREKIEQLGDRARFHFIGHLQSNKARHAAELFTMVETVDRLKIARALDRHSGSLGRSLDILLQVNVGREPQKAGVLPENLEELAREVATLPSLRLRGLMTMPPYTTDPEESRPFFRSLYQLARELRDKGLLSDKSQVELSMGMSRDFPVAIEEGATLIRVGTAIFGPRS
ncbi:YggS family pyridoxal phosphate-dependent enzyme [Desulfolithobacter sp.]